MKKEKQEYKIKIKSNRLNGENLSKDILTELYEIAESLSAVIDVKRVK